MKMMILCSSGQMLDMISIKDIWEKMSSICPSSLAHTDVLLFYNHTEMRWRGPKDHAYFGPYQNLMSAMVFFLTAYITFNAFSHCGLAINIRMMFGVFSQKWMNYLLDWAACVFRQRQRATPVLYTSSQNIKEANFGSYYYLVTRSLKISSKMSTTHIFYCWYWRFIT
jgi:hypothetical protein